MDAVPVETTDMVSTSDTFDAVSAAVLQIATQVHSFCSKFHLFSGLKRCQMTRDLLYTQIVHNCPGGVGLKGLGSTRPR